jgi:hypothetical protein
MELIIEHLINNQHLALYAHKCIAYSAVIMSPLRTKGDILF